MQTLIKYRYGEVSFPQFLLCARQLDKYSEGNDYFIGLGSGQTSEIYGKANSRSHRLRAHVICVSADHSTGLCFLVDQIATGITTSKG
jgi:hypothetical protein